MLTDPDRCLGNVAHQKPTPQKSFVDFQWQLPSGISNIISRVSGMFQRIVTCPVDF